MIGAGCACLAVLQGCATNTASADVQSSVASLPAQWSEASDLDGKMLTPPSWWNGFRDPLLDALVEEALKANLDLAQARATLARSRAFRDVTAAALSPLVIGSGARARNRSADVTKNSYQVGLDASWEFDAFGALGSAVAAADANVAASNAVLDATRLAIAGDVVQAYFQWHGTRERLAIARDSLFTQTENLQLTQWLAQAGLGSALDVEQAQTSVEQTTAELPALESSLRQTEHQLAVLLARPPGSLTVRLAQAGEGPRAPEWPSAGVPADLLRRRPDIVAAEANVRSALATLSQREAERKPSFIIAGNLSLAASTLSGLNAGRAVLAGISASVAWPLFDGGAARARVSEQQAILDSARASYEAAVLVALKDVEDAATALLQGRDQIASLQRASASADASLQLATYRYRAGLTNFITLLVAQRTALTLASSLSSARTSQLLSQVRLYKALGGGWQAPSASGGSAAPEASVGRFLSLTEATR
ncbi:MAG: efflux transporter outer membrane subunit [Burkholderiaceae bacterium]|nr:efflux transporter outer membrane subunit [Burkholderiaceae bacterium]